MIDAPFEPSGERGRLLDRAMRERLADSLDHVVKAIGTELGLPPYAARDAIADIRAHRQSPQVFGAYYDLVLAIERDELEAGIRFTTQLIDGVGCAKPAHWVAKLSDRRLSDADRYRRLLLPETVAASDPDEPVFDLAAGRIDAAMTLLERGFPEMAAEILALLHEIIIAVGPEDPKSLTFDGSSSYMLWGAIMLNARGQSTVLDTAQALAHESGHNVLFGLCASGPLIYNDDEESFSHPLRQDPRPMDGVFHAAYVIARMHQTLERLLQADVLTNEQREAAARDLKIQRNSFAEADAVIRQSAKLTAIGAEAIAAARAQMTVAA